MLAVTEVGALEELEAALAELEAAVFCRFFFFCLLQFFGPFFVVIPYPTCQLFDPTCQLYSVVLMPIIFLFPLLVQFWGVGVCFRVRCC